MAVCNSLSSSSPASIRFHSMPSILSAAVYNHTAINVFKFTHTDTKFYKWSSCIKAFQIKDLGGFWYTCILMKNGPHSQKLCQAHMYTNSGLS